MRYRSRILFSSTRVLKSSTIPAFLGLFSLLCFGCGDDPAETADAHSSDTDAASDSSGGDSGNGDSGNGGEAQLMPSFDVESEDFFGLPWPMDYRVDSAGHPILSNFPRSSDGMIRMFLDVIEQNVVGFGNMPVVYVVLDSEPGIESLPWPDETLDADSPVQLLDVSPEGCGQRIPIEVTFAAEGDTYRPSNTLMAAPVPGFSLAPSTPHALVVLRSFGTESGLETARPAGFEGLLSGESDNIELAETFTTLANCLDDAGLEGASIAVATVFTTQDPVDELRRLRAMVVDPARTASPIVTNWELLDEASTTGRFTTYSGIYETPIFQSGETPYTASGGGIDFDDSGEPIVVRQEEVPFVITFPERGTPPFPVLIWEDGTGAELYSHVTTSVISEAINSGFAVATFQPQFHGNRSGPTAEPEMHTFNYVNPESGRSVFRQQAIDTSYFVRVVREALGSLTGLPELDTSTLVYGGQSQGAILGALLAGVETEFVAYMLNGVGAYLSITVIERKDPMDIAAQVQALLQIPGTLDRFHPVISLVQLGAEVVDPINYARYWRGWDEHPEGSSVFMINGKLDHTTPERSVNSMTISGSATPISEPGWDVDPFGVWDLEPLPLPISGNTTSYSGDSSLTIATELSGTTGHFTIYDIEETRERAIDFLVSALDGTPVLDE